VAGAGVAFGAAEAAGVVSSADFAFLALLFLVAAVESVLAADAGAVVLLADAESAVSAALLSLERLFFVVLVSAVAAESAAFELSAVSAALLFLEALVLVAAAESAGAALSPAAAVFFLVLDVLVESAPASVAIFEESAASAFFLVVFFFVALVSVWSEEPDEPACCAPRTGRLPNISRMAASSATSTPLVDFMAVVPPQYESQCCSDSSLNDCEVQ
jgi:hypothetical protein